MLFRFLIRKVDILLSEYVRGAITVSLIIGTLIAINLSLLGIRFSIVIGCCAAVFYFIPFFGYLLTGIFAAVAAIFTVHATTTKIMLSIMTVLVANILDTALFAPKFIGAKVGLHPVALIFTLFVFSSLFGFVGLLFSIPSTAIILLLFNEWREKSNSK